MNSVNFSIRTASWPEDLELLRRVRDQVFVIEQNVPLELEWDDQDEASQHVLALDANNKPIGTGRLLADGHIGRMAVLREWRGSGVGSALMKALMELGWQQGHHGLVLNAQVHAAPFYERFGFEKRGAEFDEAGIPHVEMVLRKSATDL